VSLSGSTDLTLAGLSGTYLWQKQYDEALTMAERAVTLNPTEAQNQATLGKVLNFIGWSIRSPGKDEAGRLQNCYIFPVFLLRRDREFLLPDEEI